MIFSSNFINLGGALYLKSYELTLISEGLEMPLYTMVNLAIFNLLFILSHYFYTKSNFFNNIKNSLNTFFIERKFFDIDNINTLYLISVIALMSRLFLYTDFDALEIEQESDIFGPGIIRDVVNGMYYLYLMPIIIFFSGDLINVNSKKKGYLFFIFFLICVVCIAFINNSRATLFDGIFLICALLFLNFLFNVNVRKKSNLIKIALIVIIGFLSINTLENVSKNFIQAKDFGKEQSPFKNFKKLLINIISNEDFTTYTKSVEDTDDLHFFAENYYDKSIFNRINILIVHDNFSYLKTKLSQSQIENLKEVQINKIISIIPQPIIGFFSSDFDKRKYQTVTTASLLYGIVDYEFTKLSIGSALFSLFILFGKWTYLIFLFFFIPFFIIFDSFYDHKRKCFSPYIFVFFYTTGGGILNFLAAPEAFAWFELIFRIIPQTLLLVFIVSFLFSRLQRQKNN